MDVHVKFGDSRSNRSRDIRLPHFVTDEQRHRPPDLVVIGGNTNTKSQSQCDLSVPDETDLRLCRIRCDAYTRWIAGCPAWDALEEFFRDEWHEGMNKPERNVKTSVKHST